jgi:hypothetical protein
MKRIFLLGSERSGSNLLRTLIGNHSQIAAPIAPHFCDVFWDRFRRYKRSDGTIASLELLADLERYVNHPFNDWNLNLEKERLIETYNPKSFLHFVDLMYSEKAKQEGNSGYFSKDNHNHKYALGILKDIPNALFVYLYRDPRDQVASWMRSPIHLHTPYQAAAKWVDDQRACLQLGDFYGLTIHPIQYEVLVDKPQETMEKLFDFLGLEPEEACYQTSDDNKEFKKISLWENLGKPIIQGNYNKYRDVLSSSDVEIVETVCKEQMKRLGYSLQTSASCNFKSRLFRWKEQARRRKSLTISRTIRNTKMKLYEEKKAFLNELFSKFDK